MDSDFREGSKSSFGASRHFAALRSEGVHLCVGPVRDSAPAPLYDGKAPITRSTTATPAMNPGLWPKVVAIPADQTGNRWRAGFPARSVVGSETRRRGLRGARSPHSRAGDERGSRRGRPVPRGRRSVFDKLTMMTHEFQVEGLHLVTRAAFACGGKLDVPQALSKREICAFGRILEHRSIGLLAYRINESCVALEFGEPEGGRSRLKIVSIKSAMMSCAWPSSAAFRLRKHIAVPPQGRCDRFPW